MLVPASFKQRLRNLAHGATALEYGLLVVGVAVVIIATAAVVGNAIAALIETL
ncbi:MAG: Flp family type IVb pilin [Rhodospirillales bacterium]|nr:Flp family type IVb pilin [Rhodospirillales bacterium]